VHWFAILIQILGVQVGTLSRKPVLLTSGLGVVFVLSIRVNTEIITLNRQRALCFVEE
jgi:hypothetical protein